ncbi:FAD-dependent oxidoreductase [Piscinibacter sakaiensis]|uniref:Amine oxidase with flavin n=1 Tax=Piscinibacter sakaiensis TaxID=1547922 RepID=A0A0K8NYR2_PISS1|nr:FAD-dependent oxidoreductase [Piscinibacter sakaiensis]GAP35513.1 amine oxidase with flavin [Piscinibacter sakaiensis]
MNRPRRIAVVGAGISGLGAALALSREPARASVTLYEADGRFGGHTNTVDVAIETPGGRIRHGVDTGFLVYNERTYPRFIALLEELGIAGTATDMSFSVRLPHEDLEWNGSSLDTVFAQRSNLLRPRFWRLLAQVLRFNRVCTALAREAERSGAAAPLEQSIGDFLDAHCFDGFFRDAYFLPMVGCIWSCPTEQMLRFPIATMIRFCHNHGLLQVADRPRWFTVPGGARRYVERIVERLPDARLGQPVRAIRRLPPGGGEAGVMLLTAAGAERYDEVVLACHSDQALALLDDATPGEREVLGAIRYQPNRAVLHTDASVLPRRRRAWAAWNYEHAGDPAREQRQVCLHYLINQLQPLPFETPVVVTLNPLREPAAGTVQGDFQYAHPVFDTAAIRAQQRLPALQGLAHTWYCGAWTRYGFHEDGLMSGQDVARALLDRALHAGDARAAA